MVFEFTDSNFNETASEGVVLIQFGATWSLASREFVQYLEQLAAHYKGRALVGMLDIDNYPEVAMEYGINIIPTFLILSNGVVIFKYKGVESPLPETSGILRDMLDKALPTT